MPHTKRRRFRPVFTAIFMLCFVVVGRLIVNADGLAPLSARAARSPGDERPNVVIFIIDTLRADRLGIYGYDAHDNSPNIDALAAESVVFERAYAAAPWTLPSVASLMTSRFVCEHGVTDTRCKLPEDVSTLPERLQNAGYTTIGVYANSMVAPEFGFGRGYDFYQVSFTNEAEQANKALDLNPGEPFFLYVHNIEPHNPEFFAPEHTPGYRDVGKAVRDRIAAGYKGYRIATWEDYEAGRSQGTPDAARRQTQNMNRLVALQDDYEELYDAGVRLADRRLGSVVSALKQRGGWDNTLFIFLSDHGEEFHEHGGWSHDQSVYEELIHVPLLVRFPHGQHGGKRVADIVTLLDVMPTVLNVTGAADNDPGARGVSLTPIIGGGLRSDARFFVPTVRLNTMSHYAPFPLPRGDDSVVVRQNDWKGIWHADIDALELYDLAADPREQREIAAPNPELAAAMQDFARQFRNACNSSATPSRRAAPLDEQTLRNLRSLGYID